MIRDCKKDKIKHILEARHVLFSRFASNVFTGGGSPHPTAAARTPSYRHLTPTPEEILHGIFFLPYFIIIFCFVIY